MGLGRRGRALTAGSPALTWLAPVLVRRAALPLVSLDTLAGDRVRTLADRLDGVEDRLHDHAATLPDELYRRIGGEDDRDVRRALLSLRRDVHNARTPRDPSLVARVVDHPETGGGLAAALETWFGDVGERDALLADAPRASECDRRARRRALARLWRDPAVRVGVLFAQPQLRRDLDRSLADPERPADHDDTRPLDTLLAYACRAASKTSPFSAFTTTEIRSLEPAGGAPAPSGAGTRSRVHTDVRWVEDLAALVAADPCLRAALPVSVNPTLERDGATLRFLAPARRGAEALRTVECDPHVDLLLLLVDHLPPPARWGDLAERLRSVAPEPATLRALTDRLEQLLAAGALTLGACHGAEPARLLSELAAGLPDPVRAALLDLDHEVHALPASDPEALPGALRAAGEEARRLVTVLGGDPAAVRDDRLVHHESYRLAGPAVGLDALGRARGALERLTRLLPLFDGDVPLRRGIAATFLRHHGPRDQVTPLELFRALWSGDAGPDPLGAAADGDSLQLAAVADRKALVGAVRDHLTGAGGTVELPAALLETWGERASRHRDGCPPMSAALMVQPVDSSAVVRPGDAPPPAVVVNKVVVGYGTVLARHAAADGPSEQTWLRDRLGEALTAVRPDAEPVELVATFGFGGQLRPPLTARCLRYPGAPIRRVGQPEVAWSDVRVAWNDGRRAPELVDTRTGRTLLPVHLGTLSALHFPPFYRFVTGFGPAFAPDVPWLHLLDPDPSSAGVRALPRLTHEGVVLMRATWAVPADAVPEPASDEVTDFRRLRGWARENRLPRRAFVAPLRTDEYLRGVASRTTLARAVKPFLMDFEEPALHRLFRRYTALPAGTLTVTEVLPDREHLPPDGHAVELVVEVTVGGRP